MSPASRTRPRSGEFHNRSKSEFVRRPSFVEVSKQADVNEGLISRPPVPAFQKTAPSIRSASDAVTRLWEDSRAALVQSTMIGEELGRLYLWGQGFNDGDLEIILRQSKELEDTVLESLSSIGETLIKSMSFFCSILNFLTIELVPNCKLLCSLHDIGVVPSNNRVTLQQS
jgi:hypothetical protein